VQRNLAYIWGEETHDVGTDSSSGKRCKPIRLLKAEAEDASKAVKEGGKK